MSDSESISNDIQENMQRRKRGRIPPEYKQNQVKQDRFKGDAYVDHKVNEKPAKQPRFSSCR